MDMVVLAHIKEQSRLSLGSYGRPRMTEPTDRPRHGVQADDRRAAEVAQA